MTNVTEREAILAEAVRAVIAAANAYLPPDGIDAKEAMTRVLAAVDNARVAGVLGIGEVKR